MPNPFSAEYKKRRADTPSAVPVLQGHPQGKTDQQQNAGLLRPRNPRIGRAVQLLDVLTSGDDVFLSYLKEHGTQAVQVVEEAKADMAEAETPEEAEDFRPDPMDELVALMSVTVGVADAPTGPGPSNASTPPPTAMDLQSLKNALLVECQNTIRASSLSSLLAPPPPSMFLDNCGITGCCIHSISPETGEIIHHYTYAEMTSQILKRAEKLLKGNDTLAYVEVRGERLYAVTATGTATEYSV